MRIGVCKYCLEEKELAQGHLIPAGVLKLCKQNGEVLSLSSAVVQYTGRERQHPLLCKACEASLSRYGEEWVIPRIARPVSFPIFELLNKEALAYQDGVIKIYAAARIPELDVEKMTHFALGIFWKASTHSWRGKTAENLIELGPYREELRAFLRRERGFPRYVCLIVSVQPPPALSFTCEPYRARKFRVANYGFYVPGVTFWLFVGKQLGSIKKNCFYSNPAHPIVVRDTKGQITDILQDVTRGAKISKRVMEGMKSRRPR